MLKRIVPRDWNAHYSDPANISLDPAPLLVQVADLLPPGSALDLASGPGRNALYLARLGWQVVAVDSSAVAISHLRRQNPAIDAHLADLEKAAFRIAPAAYDLICDFYYLQRDLFPQIRDGVRPGGIFTGAVHLFEPGRNPAFSLRPGELRDEFAAWKILYYSEAPEPQRSRSSASIIARRA
jgi:SAM-dependent methyltransferase